MIGGALTIATGGLAAIPILIAGNILFVYFLICMYYLAVCLHMYSLFGNKSSLCLMKLSSEMLQNLPYFWSRTYGKNPKFLKMRKKKTIWVFLFQNYGKL